MADCILSCVFIVHHVRISIYIYNQNALLCLLLCLGYYPINLQLYPQPSFKPYFLEIDASHNLVYTKKICYVGHCCFIDFYHHFYR